MNHTTSSSARLLDPARFEGQVNGKPVSLFVLKNAAGMTVCITNYGAKIEQILLPDQHGHVDDIVLGYDSLDGVIAGLPSMGAFVGRYAGRIDQARFTLSGTTHVLSANNGPHCLHGGRGGSSVQVFDAIQTTPSQVVMRYTFADGEEGFPGTLALKLTYSVLPTNELMLEYEAVALDKPTVASFTTHAFFNLNGESSGSALNHEVTIFADQYFGMRADLIATGELLPVDNTLFDLRQAVLLNSRVHSEPCGAGLNGQKLGGYDDCFLVKKSPTSKALTLCARVNAPQTGRVMEVWSTEPALQFYTGVVALQPLAGGPGKNGQVYLQHQGMCFEPQGYPNAPNCPAFRSAHCLPGQNRIGTTVYRFSQRGISNVSPG